MKKIISLLAILFSCIMLGGCSNFSEKTQEQPLTVYSISGSNEYLKISNEVLVLSSSEEIFYGGDLEVYPEKFDDVTAYSMTCYIVSNNEKHILLSNNVQDMTGEKIAIQSNVGKLSGDGIISGKLIEELQNNLFFELETTHLDGKQDSYLLQLTVTEVTERADK